MTASPKNIFSELRRTSLGLTELPRAMRLFWDASKGGTVLWLLLLTALGLLPAAAVIATRSAVDNLLSVTAIGIAAADLTSLILSVSALGGSIVLMMLISGWADWLRNRQVSIVEDHIAGLIHRTAMTVDMAFYETPGYFDHLHRARMEALHRPASLMETAGALLQSAITLIAMSALLLSFHPLIPLILLLSTLPALAIVVRNALAQHRFRLAHTEDERRAWYADYQLTCRESAAELRLFSLGPSFFDRFQQTRRHLREGKLSLQRDLMAAQLLAGLIALAAAAACLVWIGMRAIDGSISIGELVLFLAAFRQGQQMMTQLLSHVGDIYRNLIFLSDLFTYLDLRPAIVSPDNAVTPPIHVADEVRFNDVSFQYPGTDQGVLDHFSVALKAGKITAIVGENGAGKSTLVRLLCRFYDPDSGSVTIDGTPLSRFELDTLRSRISVLFQTPVQYSESVSTNISLFNPAHQEQGQIENAARASGAHAFIERLEHGYGTLLGHWFDGGRDLSVGEWQRIALSRAFLRDTAIVLLDEPTSAMDSWAEAEWISHLKELVKNKTTLLITHRFTTAMQADIIHVMKNGAIVESGSHEELLSMNGLYATSWKQQMSK